MAVEGESTCLGTAHAPNRSIRSNRPNSFKWKLCLRLVFNSSGVYQGQCFKVYWMKCQYRLNNLFGIILPFREKGVAIVGDISKMYHRILILEQDQHVHRFFWRDLDENRQPDVYVNCT